MKIVVTGATGFVGANLIRHFNQLGHEVIGMSRTQKPLNSLTQQCTYVSCDIGESVPPIDCDICIHSAALATDAAPYQDFYQTNYIGTQNVFKSIRCRKFIYISSSSVYHFEEEEHFEKEQIPIDQLANYGKTKRLAEIYLEKQKGKGTDIFILRPRAIYGIGDRVLLPRILNLLKKEKIKLPGDLKINCSLTHVKNLIHAIELCVQSEFNFKIYNVADDMIYELREVIENLIKDIFDKDFPIVELPLYAVRYLVKSLAFFKIPFRISLMALNTITQPNVLNIEKIKTELNYQPQRTFFKSKKEIAQWAKRVGVEEVIKGNKDLPWKP